MLIIVKYGERVYGSLFLIKVVTLDSRRRSPASFRVVVEKEFIEKD